MGVARLWSSSRPRVRKLLLVIAVFVVAVVVFDWNWFRGPVERYLRDQSGREVRIDHLDVSFGFNLEPSVHLRGIYIENTLWARNRQPMVVAHEAIVRFALRSLWEQRPIITRVVLRDADVDLEKTRDGLRNWRLTNPQHRGRSVVKILTLETHRSRIRFFDGSRDIEVFASSTPTVPYEWTTNHQALVQRIAYSVTHRGKVYAGAALAGEAVSFRDSFVSFPLRGYVITGRTRLDAEGSVADLLDISALDAKVRIAGPTLADLQPFLPVHFASARSFSAESRVRFENRKYTLERLRARMGATEFTGDASLDGNPDRPLLAATLQSRRADWNDLAALYGGDRGSAGKDKASEFGLEDLKKIDAGVTFQIRALRVGSGAPIENLRIDARLADGVLRLTPVNFAMAGGKAAATLVFNGRQEPPNATATLEVHRARLERLLPAVAEALGSGEMYAHLKLSATGASLPALLARGDGSLALLVDRGSISNLADAKLGLNVGKAMSVILRGDRRIPVHCGAVAFDFTDGVGKSRAMLLDTDQTYVEGAGTISLRNQRFSFIFDPRPKSPGLLTLGSFIELRGSFKPGALDVQRRLTREASSERIRADTDHAAFLPLLKSARDGESRCIAVLRSNAPAANSVAVKQ